MISPKIESEILQNCSEQEPQGLEEELEQLGALASDKKLFLRNSSKFISILVSGKYNTVEKNKKIINAEIMVRTNVIVRRSNQLQATASVPRIGNKCTE